LFTQIFRPHRNYFENRILLNNLGLRLHDREKIQHEIYHHKNLWLFPKNQRTKLVVEENIIGQTMEMKYLGIRLSSYGNIEDEFKEQVT
jgi:hypothetical protein